MKVCRRLEQKVCLISTALSLFLGGSSFSVNAQTGTPKSFADWCLNKENLLPETKHTVDMLLKQAGTSDCYQAN